MRPKYLAHILPSDNAEQTVKVHCRNTASYAKEALEPISLSSAAYLAGLLHDMGKDTDVFQKYLYSAVYSGDAARGSVNHTFAAVRFLLQRYHDPSTDPYVRFTSELLSYAVGAHHGLFDCIDEKHHSGFLHRLEKDGICYEEALSNYLKECACEAELDKLFHASVHEIMTFVAQLSPLMERGGSAQEVLFYYGLLSRLLLSAVIEGDRRDTAEFMGARALSNGPPSDDLKGIWPSVLARVEFKLDGLPCDSPIEKARHIISERCRRFAERPGGVYRLNVPTGAGKTLSSLRYALAHAARWGKSRIIFTSPLLSILEQNAQVIRDFVQDNSLILEHHSNVIDPPESSDAADVRELLVDSWDAPIIITTLVQLLNTLFDGRTSCIRRFHALCNSVIVIDEVQTVPNNLLTLFNLAVNFLAATCGATVILCSATQPCLEETPHPLASTPDEIVPYDADLWAPFRRTDVRDAGSMTLEDIPSFAEKILQDADSLLIVCNKKAEAETLYRSFNLDIYQCFHLSASMCMAHRRRVLQDLQFALDHPSPGKKTICVSTQVIEAGVDISFSRVIRISAGMDSIVQSAGRCNRNGESNKPAPVYIVQCSGESLRGLSDIQRAKNATNTLLAEFRQNPVQYGNDLVSDVSIRHYYKALYREMKRASEGFQDAPVSIGGKKTTLFSLLSDNAAFIDSSYCSSCLSYFFNQAFRSAGNNFTVFDSNTTDVIVPFEQGKEIILDLGEIKLPYDLARLRGLLSKAKNYTVCLYKWQIEALEKQNALVSLCGGSILVLQDGYYDLATGFTTNHGDLEFLEV